MVDPLADATFSVPPVVVYYCSAVAGQHLFFFFFFNDPAPTEIYPLPLHDPLPILATGLALGNGGVFVGQAPDLFFLQDTNRDDHADTRKVLLTVFGMEDRHELLNGFTWGPDGWL